MIIEGKNAVLEALRGSLTIEKVMFLDTVSSSNFSNLITICKDNKIKFNFVEKNILDRLAPGGKHQGVVAQATEFVYSDLDSLLSDNSQDKLLLLLDGIEDPHNLGAIIRVADCAGVTGVVLPRHRSCGVTDTVVKVSCGACSHVKIAKVSNINDTIKLLQNQNIRVFATDMLGDDIYKTNLLGDVAFVIGGEDCGVHTLTKKLSDATICLPQRGKVNSLNASVASGIVVYECLRQRGSL